MGSLFGTHMLACHPQTPDPSIVAMGVAISASGKVGHARLLQLEFRLIGNVSAVRLPAAAAPVPTDDLWRTTCFELFVHEKGDRYREYNFSPSGAYAAYAFDHYRVAMTAIDMARPSIDCRVDHDAMAVRVGLDDAVLDGGCRFGISAVIDHGGGQLSYWALRHPSDKPDFHHRDCFALLRDAPEDND